MRRREHGGFVPAGQVELMIGITVVLVIAAIAIPNILLIVRKSRRDQAIERVVAVERTWRKENGSWLEFENNAQLHQSTGFADDACDFSAVADGGSNGALVMTVLCPQIGSTPIEKRIEP